MAWQIEIGEEFERGTLNDLVERAIGYMPDSPTEEQAWKAIDRAIDEGCIHYSTKLAIIQWLGLTSELFGAAWDDLAVAIYNRIDFEEE